MDPLKAPPPPHASRPRASLVKGLVASVAAAGLALLSVPPALAAPSDDSEALAQVVNADLLGIDLADAGTATSGFPSDPGASYNELDVELLEALRVTLGTIDIPLTSDPDGDGLLHLGEAGVLSSYAVSEDSTSSTASAGVVGKDGSLSLDPGGTGEYGSTQIRLTPLLDQLGLGGTDAVVDDVSLQVGAFGSTATADTTATPEVSSEYVVVDGQLRISSPFLGDVVTEADGIVDDLGTTIEGLTGTDGVLTTALGDLYLDANVLGLIQVAAGVDTIEVTGIEPALAGVTDALLATPLEDAEGLVSIDLSSGVITVDIDQLGDGLNERDANTEVLSGANVEQIVGAVEEALGDVLAERLGEIIREDVLKNIGVELDLTAELTALLSILPIADANIHVDTTLAQLLGTDTTTSPTITTDANLLGIISVGQLITGITDEVQSQLIAPLGVILDGVLGDLTTDLSTTVGSLLDPLVEETLSPVLDELVSELVTVTVNHQPEEGRLGAESFTVNAIAVQVLPNLLSGDAAVFVGLGSSTVRAAAVEPVITADPDSVQDGETTTITGGDFPAETAVEVQLTDAAGDPVGEPVDVTTDETGAFTTDLTVPEGTEAGEYTVVGTAASGETASAPLQVTNAPSVAAVPDRLPAGNTTVVTGEDFPADTEVTVQLNDPDGAPIGDSVTVTTDADGNFTAELTVPADAEESEDYQVEATASSGESATTPLAVIADNQEVNTADNTADNTEVNTGDNTAENTDVNTEVNTAENTDVNTADNTDVNTAENTDVNTAENTDVNTAENTDVNTAENTDVNTEINTAENTDVNTEVNTAENTDVNTAENTDVNTEVNTAENTDVNTADNTDVNTAENTDVNTDVNTAENTDVNTADNTDVNTEVNTAENTDVNTAENTDVNTEVNTAENTDVNTADNTDVNTDVNTAENTDVNTAENTDVNTDVNTAENTDVNTEVNTAENTDVNTEVNTAENTDVNTDVNTAENTDVNTAENTAENTDVNTAENTDVNTEVNTAENTDVNTADNTDVNTEVNTAENTDVNTEVNTAENTDVNTAENTDVNTEVNTAENTDVNTDVNTAENTDVNTAENTDVNTEVNTAENTDVNTDVNTAENTDVNTADNTDVNTAENTDVNTEVNTAENTDVNTEVNTAENTEVNTAENTEVNTAENTEVNTAENTDVNTEVNTAENTEVNTADNTADNTAVAELNLTPTRAVQGQDDVLAVGTGYTPDGSAEVFLRAVDGDLIGSSTTQGTGFSTLAAVANPGESIGTVTVDENGEITFRVASSELELGDYVVTATDLEDPTLADSAYFTVVPAQDGSDDNTADNTSENTADNAAENTEVNTEVNTADNAAENTEVNTEVNTADNAAENTEVNTEVNTADNTADNTGDNTGDDGTAVDPGLTVDPDTLAPGDSTTVIGEGFPPNTAVDLQLTDADGNPVGDPVPVTTDDEGSFVEVLTVLDGTAPGEYTLVATAETGESASAPLTITGTGGNGDGGDDNAADNGADNTGDNAGVNGAGNTGDNGAAGGGSGDDRRGSGSGSGGGDDRLARTGADGTLATIGIATLLLLAGGAGLAMSRRSTL